MSRLFTRRSASLAILLLPWRFPVALCPAGGIGDRRARAGEFEWFRLWRHRRQRAALNVRDAPTTNARILGKLPAARVAVVGRSGNWF